MSLETTENNTAIRKMAYDQAVEIRNETLYLALAGKASEAEKVEAELSVDNAAIDVFSVLIDEYVAYMNLLVFSLTE